MNRARTMRLFVATAVSVAASSAALGQQPDPFPLPPKEWPKPVMDTQPFTYVLLDRLEYRSQPGRDLWVWDAQGWHGGDMNKLWVKTEGEKEVGGRTERAELQLLYAHRISPYWHLQAGVRSETRLGRSEPSAVLGVQGLAPYWFDVEAMLFAERKGVAGRLELETDVQMTQRWILQPRIETQLSSFTDRERGVGSGIEHVEAGLRLRYEIRREFAPYIGITWSRKVGQTASLARDRGDRTQDTGIAFGVRMWY